MMLPYYFFWLMLLIERGGDRCPYNPPPRPPVHRCGRVGRVNYDCTVIQLEP